MADQSNYTIVGTNIDEVKRRNAASGLSYNEVLSILANTGGHNTKKYSNTDPEKVRKEINRHLP